VVICWPSNESMVPVHSDNSMYVAASDCIVVELMWMSSTLRVCGRCARTVRIPGERADPPYWSEPF
jgi:hypothetical protein